MTKSRYSEITTKCFSDTVEAVHKCPALFFIDKQSEIFCTQTYLMIAVGHTFFQVRWSGEYPEGRGVPIAFVSKSFDARMRKWDTPQKEGFAIFYALLKLNYLLRNRRFTIRTDQKNLAILRGDSYLTTSKKYSAG